MPAYTLRSQHHGAGMVSFFNQYRHLVPEFKDEFIFRGFLIAFGRHVRSTIDKNFGDLEITHWWKGQLDDKGRNVERMFLDSSQGGIYRVFNEQGRQRLSLYLAEQTFISLEQYFIVGSHRSFLESEYVPIEPGHLAKHLEIPKGSLEEELLKAPKRAPVFALPKSLAGAERARKISETMLAKRPPTSSAANPKKAMSCKERKALSRSQLSEKAKDELKEREAAGARKRRLQKKQA